MLTVALGAQLGSDVSWFEINGRFEGHPLDAYDVAGPVDKGAPVQEPRRLMLPC